ncbi:hypothetical protein ACIQBJ_15255 [Kitasatospora sp. NPDC088391]|uniref:hypothetical protein n=1 Tax=Kitasatospora sp. NPDC088391 TaxID=3364074 RepID=UPI0037F8F2B6
MSPRPRPAAVAVLLCALALSATGCSDDGPPTRHVQIDWASHYTDVKELDAHSDLAVVGVFHQDLGESTDAAGITRTDFGFFVQRQLSAHGGSPRTGGTLIRVRQNGGRAVRVEDDALFVLEQHAVLFLHRIEPDVYAVVGGPNGRFDLPPPPPGTSSLQPFDDAVVVPYNDETARFSGSIRTLAALLDPAASTPLPSP